jgi:hypothetical protein
MKIEFRPKKRPDGKFAYEVFKNEISIGFVHFIESVDGKIYRINHADMVMSPVWTIEQAEAECAWLNDAYKRGEIK